VATASRCYAKDAESVNLICRWRPPFTEHGASRTCVGVVAALMAATVVAAPSEDRLVLVTIADQAGQPMVGLQPHDFAVENGGMPCEVVGVTPASYPLAIVLDTSGQARADFRTLQLAAQQFVDALSPRALAVYTSGGAGARLQVFTTDRTRIARAMAGAAAAPNASTNTLDAIRRASRDLAHLKAPVTGIVVVSAGGTETSPPTIRQVWAALLASGTILSVIEERTLRLDPGMPHQNEGDVLQALAIRSHGKYLRGASASVYASGLEMIRRQLDSQSVLRYVVAPGAPRSISVHVRAPAIIVMAMDLDR
jgi:hypothetical protein